MTLPKEMYQGKVNSPETIITESIGSGATSIKVQDASMLPDGPNIAVIGTDANAETIKYSGINDNILVGCERGFQGTAQAWDANTIIARNITEYDLGAVQENIIALEEDKAGKAEVPTKLAQLTEDASHRLVTDSEKIAWDGKAEMSNIPKKLSQLEEDTSHRIVSDSEKSKWNNKITMPSGGTSGQVLKKTSEGVAWKADNNTTYSNATQSTSGLMSNTDKKKLDGVETGANKYSHPSTHPASMITETSSKRFVSDSEKAAWNGKAEISDIPAKLSQLTKDINFDDEYEPKNNNIQSHISNTENPHKVDRIQVGLGSVHNYGIASQAEAEEGTATNKYMTPQRTKQAIDKKVKKDVPADAIFTDTVYTHPSSHPASMIKESKDKRFVSDEEKTKWNAKLTPPSGGSAGQFLQKTDSGYKWENAGDIIKDPFNLPGPKKLIAGDKEAGFFGTLRLRDLGITENGLRTYIPLTEGIHEREVTLGKFFYKNKILFITLNPLYLELSVGHFKEEIIDSGFKNVPVVIAGNKFKLRTTNMCDENHIFKATTSSSLVEDDILAIQNNEFNKLYLPLLGRSSIYSGDSYVGTSDVPMWSNINISDSLLCWGGYRTLCVCRHEESDRGVFRNLQRLGEYGTIATNFSSTTSVIFTLEFEGGIK